MDKDIYESDILTIEEVAKYLRVSARTVYDWAQKGQIPAGKIGNVWRFKRSELEEWVNGRLTTHKASEKKTQDDFDIESVLTPSRIVFLDETDKVAALTHLASVLSQAKQVADPTELTTQMLKREELMSTAVGKGIAIPHVRLSSVTDLVAAVGISRNGISDFVGVDGEKVAIMVMIAAGIDQHEYYLRVISHFSAKILGGALIEEIKTAPSEKAVYKLLFD